MKKIIIITCICLGLIGIAYVQFTHTAKAADPRGSAYAGAKACSRCHHNEAQSLLHTAHQLASAPANESTVHGSFAQGKNVFTIDKDQKIVMEKKSGGLYQTYYFKGRAKKRYRFDMVFGGVKGESYLYWKNNELYQLPLSYYSQQQQWSTSPGYGFSFIGYRAIGLRCMECHASYIGELPQSKERLAGNDQFDKKSMIYGIDCERCHGPGAQHVEYQTDHPDAKTAQFITRYASLTRGQKMDMCAVCHSGIHKLLLKSTFAFVPGDTFARYKLPEMQEKVDTAAIDVHGKQLQLLQSSRCYIYSKMDCATCHDTHQNTRGNEVLYTQKCLSCHNTGNHSDCKMTRKLTPDLLQKNCISCHMPKLTTNVISVQIADKAPPVRFSVHTHHIAVYPQEVKKILSYINR